MGKSHACFSETTTAAASTPLQTIKMVEMKGTYERTAADKYDEFLTALDVNMLLRKAAASSFPPFMTVSVSEETGEWTIKTWAMLNKEDGSLMLKMKELKFKLGEEFEKSTKMTRE